MQNRLLSGAWHDLVGPLDRGASAVVLVVSAAAAAAVSVPTSRRAGVARGTVAGIIAFDLVGGLVAFQLPASRQKYARSTLRSRMTFALAHVQPFALPILGEGSLPRAAARYSTAVLATAALERFAPRTASRRVLANSVAALASTADVLTDVSDQRWFGPVYLMKVIGGHAGIPQR